MFQRYGLPAILLLCIVVLYSAVSTFAQNGMPKFERISTQHGLPHSIIYGIIQDQRGFIWFGTKEGLVRYDGYSFVTYSHDPLDSSSISENRVFRIYEEKSGNLWVGTGGGGLNYFNRKTGKFKSYRHNPAIKTSISSDHINYIMEDTRGFLWIGTDNGLNKFDRTTQTFTAYTSNNQARLSSNVVRAIFADVDSTTLWLGTTNGLNKFDAQTGLCVGRFFYGNNSPALQSSNNIFSLCQGENNTLWVGNSLGILVFNCATQKYTDTYENFSTSKLPGENTIWALSYDLKGNLWAATQRGLRVLYKRTNRWQTYLHDPLRQETPSHNITSMVYCDKSGIMWIGTYGGGLNKYDPQQNKFTHFKQDFLQTNSLINNNVWALHEDKNALLWIGTLNGFCSFNKTTGEYRHYHNDTARHGSISDNVNIICESSDGSLWLGTYGGGLFNFNPATNKKIVFRSNPRSPTTLLDNRITALYEDKAGILWVGTTSGLHKFNKQTSGFERFTGDPNDKQTLSYGVIKSIFEDKKGRFWVGTANGLNLFDRNSGFCTRYIHDFKNPRSISHSNIRTLYEDTKGTLWISTTGGLNKFNEDGTFTRYTKKDGLPSDLVAGILEDNQGNLWLSTENGVAKFSPRTGTSKNFTTGDGLQAKEFRPGSFCKGKDGMMYFGGNNGFNAFYPDSINENTLVPPVAITSFKKFNQTVTLSTEISETPTISLSYHDYLFSFEFAALNYSNSQLNQYAYKLEGFDDHWVFLGPQRYAVFTNLDGGEYYFRVKASNNDNLWNETGATIKIIITPPFWNTWWFRSLSILCIALGTFFGYKWRMKDIESQKRRLELLVYERTAELEAQAKALESSNAEIQRQNAILDEQAQDIEIKNTELQESNLRLESVNNKLESLHHEKNEIFGIVAHDLKNPLSNIKALSKILYNESQTLQPSEIREFTTDIQYASERMFTLITNLLDVNRIEVGGIQLQASKIDLLSITEGLVYNYTPHADAKQIRLLFQPDMNSTQNQEGIFAFADENAMIQVLENLISNAIKYSPSERNVYVRLRSLEEVVQVEVSDEGPGLTAEDKEKLFGKFARLSAQPTGGEHSTGLGLSIVKKLIETMNGRVWCESEYGKGASFFVEVPAIMPSYTD